MSRLDKLKEQHPELNINVIDLISIIDPTDTYKYTEFLIKHLKTWYSGTDIQVALGVDFFGDENIEVLNKFENHVKANRIQNKDISQHKDFRTLLVEVKNADEIVRLKELEKQTKKLFDNEEWLVLIPLSYEASKLYGMDTKWCTTQEKYWNDYIVNYKLIYVINKKTNGKYAISRHKGQDHNIKGWLSDDEETSPLLLPIPQELWTAIMPELQKQESVIDLNGISNKIVDFDINSDNLIDSVRRLIGQIEPEYTRYGNGDGDGTYYTYRSTYDDGLDEYLREYSNTN